MPELTEREIACLKYLIARMDATSQEIGEAIAPNITGGRRQEIWGDAVASGLRRRKPPLVQWLPYLHAWKITPEGREALAPPAMAMADHRRESRQLSPED